MKKSVFRRYTVVRVKHDIACISYKGDLDAWGVQINNERMLDELHAEGLD